jgi:uncharacterized protein (DUF58 family)
VSDLPQLGRDAARLDVGFLRRGAAPFSGRHGSTELGQGMTFAEVRDYEYGDDVRHLDWNVTARLGRPFSRRYERERGTTVLLVLDLSGSLRPDSDSSGKAQLARELGQLFGLWALRGHERLGALFCTDRVEHEIPPRRGNAHVGDVLRAIERWQPSSTGTNLAVALRHAAATTPGDGLVVVVSDFFDRQFQQPLARLSSRNSVLAVEIVDVREATLPSVGLLRCREAETGTYRWVDTSSRRVRQAYETLWRERRAAAARAIARAGAGRFEARVGEPYLARLIQLSRRRRGPR